MSHTTSPGDLPALVEASVEVLEKRRLGAKRPRKATQRATRSRHIPAAARRAVYERDGGRCTFQAQDGRRCGERHKLQFDHIVPFANGGPSTPSNLRLLCQTHHLLEARRVLGPRAAQPTLGL